MKKVYAAPTVVDSGSTVRETLVMTTILGPESQFKRPQPAGSVGFYL